jgi:hypothetical protein
MACEGLAFSLPLSFLMITTITEVIVLFQRRKQGSEKAMPQDHTARKGKSQNLDLQPQSYGTMEGGEEKEEGPAWRQQGC